MPEVGLVTPPDVTLPSSSDPLGSLRNQEEPPAAPSFCHQGQPDSQNHRKRWHCFVLHSMERGGCSLWLDQPLLLLVAGEKAWKVELMSAQLCNTKSGCHKSLLKCLKQSPGTGPSSVLTDTPFAPGQHRVSLVFLAQRQVFCPESLHHAAWISFLLRGISG